MKNSINEHAENLIRILKAESISLLKKKGQFIDARYEGTPCCLILLDGVAAAYRVNDNILINYITAPYVLGLTGVLKTEMVYIRTLTDVELGVISIESATDLIERNNMWKEVALYISEIIIGLANYHNNTMGRPTQDLIEYLINKLLSEPLEIRSNTVVADYILDKTNLSKSTIMKTLAIFKEQGRLESERGVLVKFT